MGHFADRHQRFVMSPLWTDRPDLISQYSLHDQKHNTTDEVATAMCNMVQSKVYPGGSIVQFSPEGTSIVPFDPPISLRTQEIAPVREILKAERGGEHEKGNK